jgi:stress-induced-phosphoprotein 1
MKKYDEAMEAYEKGLEVAPEDAALRNGLSEVMKAKSSTIRNPLAGAFGGDVMGKLAGHPKFSTYLRDPAFVKNVQLFQQTQNFQLVQTDPRMMEVLTFLLGIELPADEAGDDDASTPAHPAPQGSRTPQAAPAAKAEPTIDPNETKEEKAARENRAAALEAKKRGNEHYSQKEFDLASACYEEAIALDPANMTFISNKAAVAFEKGDLDGCIELCRAAVEVGRAHRADYADIAKAFVRMGKAAAKGGDLAAAIEFYKSAQVENYTKEVERIIKNTELDLRKKTAMEYIDPEKALEAKERGNEHFRSGKWTDAIAEYQEAVKRDPENAIYRNNLASALLKVWYSVDSMHTCRLPICPQYLPTIFLVSCRWPISMGRRPQWRRPCTLIQNMSRRGPRRVILSCS